MPPYRVFGNELSPYSVKVRSYFRYKDLPHEWIPRTIDNQAEFDALAKLPLIPLVVTPEGAVLQDSTPIIEKIEAIAPEPSITPPDPVCGFLSAMIEEYADEWGNKSMFHYRWTYPADQESGAERIARGMNPGLDAEALATVKAAVKHRMVPRLSFVGSTADTLPQIEGSFRRVLRILEKHLASRHYLFGDRPSLGDFGLFGQIYELSTDPTPGTIMRESAPTVLAWIERMLDPTKDGDWQPWDGVHATLLPLLTEEIAGLFLPWSAANATALAAGEKTFTATLEGKPFAQEAQRYHAKSLGVLRARYAAVTDKSALDPILERTGCLGWLR